MGKIHRANGSRIMSQARLGIPQQSGNPPLFEVRRRYLGWGQYGEGGHSADACAVTVIIPATRRVGTWPLFDVGGD